HRRLAEGPPAPQALEADGVAEEHEDEGDDHERLAGGEVCRADDVGPEQDQTEQQSPLCGEVDRKSDTARADARRTKLDRDRLAGHDRTAVRRLAHLASLPR